GCLFRSLLNTARRAICLSRSASRSPVQAEARMICARLFFSTEASLALTCSVARTSCHTATYAAVNASNSCGWKNAAYFLKIMTAAPTDQAGVLRSQSPVCLVGQCTDDR